MGKDTHLINIYLKIHNKLTLTMEDLSYLARYAPECFEKTCKNVIYNIPEAKHVMDPESSPSLKAEEQEKEEYQQTEETITEQPNINKILENIKQLEMNQFPVKNLEADKVKNLLGNLYMELMFPHNDKETFIKMEKSKEKSAFDRKI